MVREDLEVDVFVLKPEMFHRPLKLDSQESWLHRLPILASAFPPLCLHCHRQFQANPAHDGDHLHSAGLPVHHYSALHLPTDFLNRQSFGSSVTEVSS